MCEGLPITEDADELIQVMKLVPLDGVGQVWAKAQCSMLQAISLGLLPASTLVPMIVIGRVSAVSLHRVQMAHASSLWAQPRIHGTLG